MKFALAAFGLAVATLTTPAFAADEAAPIAAAFTIDTPIEALMADERAKAAVSAHLPGIDQHPAYEQFKALSLKAVAPFSQGLITDEVLAKIAADLAAIK
jgi:hypothetical protein